MAASTLLKELGLEGTGPLPGFSIGSLVEELLAEGQLRGSFKASTWTPAVYQEAQQAALHRSYNQDGYVRSASIFLDHLACAGQGTCLAYASPFVFDVAS